MLNPCFVEGLRRSGCLICQSETDEKKERDKSKHTHINTETLPSW